MTDQRQHNRTMVSTKVKLTHHETGSGIFHTRDISNGGLYLLRENGTLPALGELVRVQAQGMAVEAPVILMRVVREDAEGIGLEIVEVL